MARTSKLTDKQWAEIERKHLDGVAARVLGREYGITDTAIRKRINSHTKPIKELANQMAAVEVAYENLPVSSQVKVRNLADVLKGISHHLGAAAEHGAATAHKLATIARAQAEAIRTDADTNSDALRSVAALTGVANEAAKIGLNLLAANKDAAKEAEADVPCGLEHFYGGRHYD